MAWGNNKLQRCVLSANVARQDESRYGCLGLNHNFFSAIG